MLQRMRVLVIEKFYIEGLTKLLGNSPVHLRNKGEKEGTS